MHSMSQMTAEKPGNASMKPAEMRKLIIKLRWIGMEEEAERLSDTLARSAPSECPLFGPRDTD